MAEKKKVTAKSSAKDAKPAAKTKKATKVKEEEIEEIEAAADEPQAEIIDPPDIDSKYRMIILAAQRSKQLQRGALNRVEADSRKTKPTRIAMKEFEEKKVNFDILDNN